MSKSILQSIKPRHCENIAIGIKKYELRKTKPNIPTPFKVHIYETKDKKFINMAVYEPNNNIKFEHAPGKVIAEYICDEIIEWTQDMKPPVPLSELGLSYRQIREYGGDKPLYLWHISDLKIYDKPKELREFIKPCDKDVICTNCNYAREDLTVSEAVDWILSNHSLKSAICINKLTHPPQSWCYVEEV